MWLPLLVTLGLLLVGVVLGITLLVQGSLVAPSEGVTNPTGHEVMLAAIGASHEDKLRSPATTETTRVRFENHTSRPLDVHWLDFTGKRAPYGTMEPGGGHVNDTFVGHVWLIAERTGEGVAIFVADAKPGVGLVR